MTLRHAVIAGMLSCALLIPALGDAAEKECDRWLKLVDGEVRERKEALEKSSGAERERIREEISKVTAKAVEARKVCGTGNDKDATLLALNLWDAFVEHERQEGTLSLDSRLNILALRIDRLKAFQRRGWKPNLTDDVTRALVAELDQLDRTLADVLRRALR